LNNLINRQIPWKRRNTLPEISFEVNLSFVFLNESLNSDIRLNRFPDKRSVHLFVLIKKRIEEKIMKRTLSTISNHIYLFILSTVNLDRWNPCEFYDMMCRVKTKCPKTWDGRKRVF